MAALADTSAWAWSRKTGYSHLRQAFDERLLEGAIATCAMVKLELLYSTRSASEFRERRAQLDLLDDCPIGPGQWSRALDVMNALAATGGMHHRSVKWADLLIAAAAEAAGVAVLHYDEDYVRIAAITGQPFEWLAPRGTLE